ncbi:MAG: tRNA lysidine(34) synthetase TilS [Verrucomicrobiaceae bacterium]
MTLPSWLDPDQRYLLGISGGRDSVCLLHLLHQSGFQNLTLCHLNHGLRGPGSDADQLFVQQLATSLNLPLLTEKADLSTSTLSLETAARDARHHFFRKCAQKTGTHNILLAHHADDQAETILFRLLRGSAGLTGIREQQTIDVSGTPLTLLRPLLHFRRSQITAFLKKQAIPFREDPTNAEPLATRNRLRNEALPLLADIMGRDPSPALIRASEYAQEAETHLTQSLDSLNPIDPQGRIHLPTLRQLSPFLQKRTLHHFLKEAKIPDLSADLMERLLPLLDPHGPPSQNLPGGLRLRRKESRLFISP